MSTSIEMPLADLHDWDHNPRKTLRDIASLEGMIAEAGRILEPLHVWFHNGQYLILQGHRRAHVGRKLGLLLVPVIVEEDVKDEAMAMARLMQLQCGVDAFDAMEESDGLRCMVDFGMTSAEVAGSLGRPANWVQLRLDLQGMPDSGKQALCRGRMDLATAELVLKLETADERAAAVQAVLSPEFEAEPLSGVSARRMVESFLATQEARKMWGAVIKGLAKKYKRKDGYSIIENFEESSTYVYETGHPVAPHGFADEMIDARLLAAGKSGLTWGELAVKRGAAVYVVCAPLHKDGHVLVVNRTTIADAEDAARSGGLEFFLKTEKGSVVKSRGKGEGEAVRLGEGETRREGESDGASSGMPREVGRWVFEGDAEWGDWNSKDDVILVLTTEDIRVVGVDETGKGIYENDEMVTASDVEHTWKAWSRISDPFAAGL